MHTYSCTKGRKRLEPSHTWHTTCNTRHLHTRTCVTERHTHEYKAYYRGQKKSHSIFCVLELIGSVSLKLTDRTRTTTKGRTMSKLVYVRECPLYSVFWNVSIKCYILCTPVVLHFIMHYAREKTSRRRWCYTHVARSCLRIGKEKLWSFLIPIESYMNCILIFQHEKRQVAIFSKQKLIFQRCKDF